MPSEFGPLVLREQLEPEDEPGLLALFHECDDWFEATSGGPSGPADVQSLFYLLPEGKSFEDKALFTLRHEDRIVGFVDAVNGYPEPRACAVGAFLVAPSYRRRGVGTSVARILLTEARHAGLKQVTATIADGWPIGTEFLHSLGFDFGAIRPDSGNRRVGETERAVRRATLDLDPIS